MTIIRPNAGYIIPPRRFVDVGMPKSRVTAKGRYQLRKLKNGSYTGEGTPWFDNLILDSGLNQWGTGTIISGAAIGTGATAPNATETGLVTQVHYTTTPGTGHNAITALGSTPYNNTRTFVYRTTLGALNGSYSEVGVGWVTGSMFSRALILDGGGSPTTISVASDEQVDIVYQLSVYPPLTDFVDTVTISGVGYDVTGRACVVNGTTAVDGWQVATSAVALNSGTNFHALYPGAIGAVTTNPGGIGQAGGVPTTDSYSNGSYTRAGSVLWGLTSGNAVGGALAAKVPWTSWNFQYEFDPVIPKDSTKTLVLNYSTSWGRRP